MKYFEKIADEKEFKSKIPRRRAIGTGVGAVSAASTLLASKKIFGKFLPGAATQTFSQLLMGGALGSASGISADIKNVKTNEKITEKQKKEKIEKLKKRRHRTLAALAAGYLAPYVVEPVRYKILNFKTTPKIIKMYEKPIFTSTYKGLPKFGAKLTKILTDLPKIYNKAKIGADPEIIAFRRPIPPIKKIISSSDSKIIIPKTLLDSTTKGVELNPRASSKPIEVVKDVGNLLKDLSVIPKNKNIKFTNLAALDDITKSVAGGHIHIDFPNVGDTKAFQTNLKRGAAGSLFSHYIVPGAGQRAGAVSFKKNPKPSEVRSVMEYFKNRNYGKNILDTRGVKPINKKYYSLEIRHTPTWVGSPDLAKAVLETTKLTSHHPETFELTDKFMKNLLTDTGGKTKNLFNPKTHTKVMNYLERLYTKAGVSGDKTIDNIFNQAAKAKPKVDLDIYKNWR